MIERGARAVVVLALAVLLLSPQASHTAETAAGDLDPTFGMSGKIRTDFFGARDFAAAVAILPDGKILAGGTADLFNSPESPELFALARYQPDGSLDPTFGSGGKSSQLSGRLSDMAIQPDNKIVAVGTNTVIAILRGVAVIGRFNSNGSLDPMFGSGGFVTVNFTAPIAVATAVALQSNGKIVFGGFDNFLSAQNPALRTMGRLNADGSFDPSFGSGGKVLLSTPGGISGLVLQPDGKIVAAGDSNPIVQRFNANGSPDPSFGSGGDGASPGPDFSMSAIALQTDGKIVLAGSVNNFSDIALIRYNANGSLDASFGSGGITITDFGNQERALAVALQSNGKIVIGGISNKKFIVLRYNSNGSLDLSFNSTPTDFGCMDPPNQFFGDAATGVAIQPDGKIVAAGSVCVNSDFAVARYNGDNTAFDFCIRDDNNGNILLLNSNTGAYQFINCGKGVGLAGTGQVTRNGCKIELQASGPDPKRPDRSVTASVNTCTQQGSASIKFLASGMTFGIQDSDIRNNTCACR